MTFTTAFAPLFDSSAFGTDELPGWSHPARVVGYAGNAYGLDFFASDDLPGWSHPIAEAAA